MVKTPQPTLHRFYFPTLGNIKVEAIDKNEAIKIAQKLFEERK